MGIALSRAVSEHVGGAVGMATLTSSLTIERHPISPGAKRA
jgi:hypothetical protein